MTARVDPDTIAALCLVPARDPVLEALRIFCGAYEWALPDAGWLPGVYPTLAPPSCECSIIRYPMTRGFCFAELDEPGAVRAVVHVVHGADAETPIGLAAWCLDRPDEIFWYPDDLPCLGLDQLGNPASYFRGKALPVHRTPLGWLKAGCHGIVALDNDVLWEALRAPPEHDGDYCLLVEDIAHGKELRDDALCPLPTHVQLRVRPRGAS